jgi:hypothetical protein
MHQRPPYWETAFTLWILAAMFLGIVMGLILAHFVWIVATDYGVAAGEALIDIARTYNVSHSTISRLA